MITTTPKTPINYFLTRPIRSAKLRVALNDLFCGYIREFCLFNKFSTPEIPKQSLFRTIDKARYRKQRIPLRCDEFSIRKRFPIRIQHDYSSTMQKVWGRERFALCPGVIWRIQSARLRPSRSGRHHRPCAGHHRSSDTQRASRSYQRRHRIDSHRSD